MIRSLTVLAADDRAPAVPDCAGYWLCHVAQHDPEGLITERRTRTPLPLLAGSASAAAGAR
jgi:hypothetical protein